MGPVAQFAQLVIARRLAGQRLTCGGASGFHTC
jgi:hypothetical protein